MAVSTDLVLAPDGRFAYVVGYHDTSPPDVIPNPVLTIFKRNTGSGALTPLTGLSGCFSLDGSSDDGPGTCKVARALGTGDGHSLAMSADGRYLYDASQDEGSGHTEGALTIFRRNSTSGRLTQLSGKKGCVSIDGSSSAGNGTCAKGRALEGGVSSVRITPDQKYLYATTYNDHGDQPGIAIFRRNGRTGAIKQLAGKAGCITDDGEDADGSGRCNKNPELSEVFEVATLGNRYVYAPNRDDDLITVMERSKSGALTRVPGRRGCISDTGDGAPGRPDKCRKGKGLDDAERVVPSPDGRYLYVQGFRDPPAATQIAILRRSPTTGAMTQESGRAACVSGDGDSVDGPGTCLDGRGMAGGYAGTLSSDGLTLYYAENNLPAGMVIFRRNPENGRIHQLPGRSGCVSEDGSSEDGADTCTAAPGVDGGYGVTAGPRGRGIYLPASEFHSLAIFRPRSCRLRGVHLGSAALRTKVVCDGPAKLRAQLSITKAAAHGLGLPRVLGKTRVKFEVAGKKPLKIKLNAKARQGLGGLNSGQRQRLNGRLRIDAFDNLGKAAQILRGISFR